MGDPHTLYVRVQARGRAALRGWSLSGSEIAHELGIARNQLYKWQTELRVQSDGELILRSLKKIRKRVMEEPAFPYA